MSTKSDNRGVWRPLQQLLGLSVALGVGALHAEPVDITIGVNPDETIRLNLSRLLPLAEGSSWEYDRTNFSGSSPVTMQVGDKENIGGGCLKVQPLVFGSELALYLGNYGDSLSLHGIYLEHWKGLNDVLIKFETRYRVEWKDFKPEYVSGPVHEGSCQDTGRGRVERTGLVLLEDLTENLGEAGSRRGDINCRVKNTDLRAAMERADNAFNLLPGAGKGQTGSGLATVSGASLALSWAVDAMTVTDLGSGNVRIQMDFNPIIHSLVDDYSMHIDMTLQAGKGITELTITDDGSGIVDDLNDLSYTLMSEKLASQENQITPKGSCPDDSGSAHWLLILLGGVVLSGFGLLRRKIK